MKHPAKFSDPVIAAAAPWLKQSNRILDPFAGVGGIRDLEKYGVKSGIYCVEIEPEWAKLCPNPVVANSIDMLPFRDWAFDACFTSPVYGNRMSDHHDAKDGSRRITYKHTLGRDLHPANTGQLQWSEAYRTAHEWAWSEVHRVLVPRGRFVLNVSNHIRKGEEVPVVKFHVDLCARIGFEVVYMDPIRTKRMRFGENHSSRVEFEYVVVMMKL